MRWLLFVIFGLLFFTACKKEKSSSADVDPLIGKWELRQLTGGWIGQVNYPAGNGTTIQFTSTTWESKSIGGPTESGTYTKTTGFCYQTNRQMPAVVIDNMNDFYEFSGDSLFLYSGIVAADGTISKYVRVK